MRLSHILRYAFVTVLPLLFVASAMGQTVINTNGDFSAATIGQTTGITNWTLEGSAFASYLVVADPDNVSNKLLRVTINTLTGATNAWSIQPLHTGYTLQVGKVYKFARRMKGASANRTISLDGGQSVTPRYGNVQVPANVWTTIETTTFTYASGTPQIGIHLAQSNIAVGDVFHIDYIQIIDTTPIPEPDPDPSHSCLVDSALLSYDFENYSINQNLAVMSQSGTPTNIVVEDPLNATNKVIRHTPGGSFNNAALVLSFQLPSGRSLQEYTHLNFKLLMRSTDGDVGFKQLRIGAYESLPSGSFDLS